ncbi:hypothetical protein SLE2022_274190 [Rubroshorea leprosula]
MDAMEQSIFVHDEPKSSSSKRLQDKVAVITGGARGIGAATAKVFAGDGAHVVIADILDDLGTELANSIGGLYIHCDVAKEADVESAVKLALAWKGKLDIMFNNAGIGGFGGSITAMDMEQLKQLLSINLHGMVHGVKHAARAMIGGHIKGSIICTTSSAAIMGGLAAHAYSLSKAAVIGMVRTTACELGAHRIRVNCISPHGVPSEMLVAAYRHLMGNADISIEEISKIIGERGSLLHGRAGTVEDIANAALFLASEEAGFITGHNLVVDGGYTSATTNLSLMYN